MVDYVMIPIYNNTRIKNTGYINFVYSHGPTNPCIAIPLFSMFVSLISLLVRVGSSRSTKSSFALRIYGYSAITHFMMSIIWRLMVTSWSYDTYSTRMHLYGYFHYHYDTPKFWPEYIAIFKEDDVLHRPQIRWDKGRKMMMMIFQFWVLNTGLIVL